jgi:tetratricopeptide (TPR) repeat protein
MKNKTVASVVVVIILLILGFIIYKNSPTNDGRSFSDIDGLMDNKVMFGATDHEDYVDRRYSGRKKADEKFIKDAIDTSGTSKDAVLAVVQSSWDFIRDNDLDGAMKTCNEAWLIEQNNFNVDWCYGAVFGSMNDNTNAVTYLEKALTNYSTSSEMFANDYLPLSHDTSFAYLALATEVKDTDSVKAKELATKAVALLETSTKSEDLPPHVISSQKIMLAQAYYFTGNYTESRRIYSEILAEYPEYADLEEIKTLDADLKARES